jgi:flagellar biosynthesis protein FlhF
MAEVRKILGENAVIIATREEGDGVRITAALDDTSLPPPPPPSPPVSLQDEYPDAEGLDDVMDIVVKALEQHAVPRDLIERLTDTLQAFDLEDPVLALAAALDTSFTFHPLPEGKATRPLIFVGPPGAGKTLTVAKVATKLAMKGEQVSVITMDTERAGGIDQLAAFTRLLKVDLLEVEDAASLPDAITMKREAYQVLVDTAGQNPFDAVAIGNLGRMIAKTGAEAVLVMPAGLDANESAEIATIFQAAGATRLLITRLDMARRFGNLLAAAHRSRLRFCESSNASSVTVPLLPLNAAELARLLLPERQQMVNAVRQTGTHA